MESSETADQRMVAVAGEEGETADARTAAGVSKDAPAVSAISSDPEIATPPSVVPLDHVEQVPQQVIVNENASAPTVVMMEIADDTTPLVVTANPPVHADETVSLSGVPDPTPTFERAVPPPQALTTSEVTLTALHSRNNNVQAGLADDGLDEYIKSPEVQNAIVERSPGGRYVRFMEKLGSGASKDVYRAYDTQEGIEVAWNVVSLAGVPKTERNRIVNEVRLLERLHHPNIISFHGSWVNRERQEVNFVTEILSSGTLKSFINKVQVIRWKIAKRWAMQILSGLEYLHSQDPPVIHRDLKAENVFINGTSGDLRIGDLGLSTVHRNGRVLSVLGTPEFMAPDMYEGTSYDSSVDIYAFGMCMLEIFTKEIPYSECTNPAQIYKKVSAGEPPEVLSRLQSRHAREFVVLCLGHKDAATGNYIRPTAKDLLQHPFLQKRESDDDEVVVSPPLRERVISEAGESTSSPGGTPAGKRRTESMDPVPNGTSITFSGGEVGGELSEATTPNPMQLRRTSLDEYDGDRFEDMPESETNMKKVKVMMGRGQELEDEEEKQKEEVVGKPDSISKVGEPGVTAPSFAISVLPLSAQSAEPQPEAKQQYLVAAAVIENESLNTRPYPDDVLKLVVTLPVEGQRQNVQFDFHLVEDDPVQVAKEMVQELGIPSEAVLEISETISGLARAARMKIDKFNNRLNTPYSQVAGHPQQSVLHQMQPQHLQPDIRTSFSQQSVVPSTVQVQPPIPTNMDLSQIAHSDTSQGCAQQVVVQTSQAQPIQQHIDRAQVPQPDNSPNFSQRVLNQPTSGHLQQHSPLPQGVPVVPGQHLAPHQVFVPPPSAAYACPPDAHQHQVPLPSTQQLHTQMQAMPIQDQQIQYPGYHQQTPLMAGPGAITVPLAASIAPYPPNPTTGTHSYVQADARMNGASLSTIATSAMAPTTHIENVSANQTASGGYVSIGQDAPSFQQPPLPDVPLPPKQMQRSATTGSTHADATPTKQRQHSLSSFSSTGSTPPDVATDDLSSEPDLDLEEELRKLEEDFQKNMMRAKKVFDNRMDNLQRSQVEREAQHQKTLEKHQKEREDFEKRLAQEEEQQNRRLEQLQKEWERKREKLATMRAKGHLGKAVNAAANGTNPTASAQSEQLVVPTLIPTTHNRTVSGTWSVQSASPPAPVDHKQSHEHPDKHAES